jgi:basic membrane protein A
MKMKLEKVKVFIGAACLCMIMLVQPLAAKGNSDTAKSSYGRMKVAMLLSGPINDAGWSESAYKGLMTARERLNIDTAYSENLLQPDFEAVMRDYADKGYNVIICHGNEFSDAAQAVSPQFPDSFFCVVNGNSSQAPNMASFRFNTPQTGFLAGAAAALLSKTNNVAMIGGTRMPHIDDALKGFEAGAKYINPSIRVQTGFTETMTDIAKGKEMGLAYAEQGADVLCANANQTGLGVIDAAKTKDIKYIGYIDDQYATAPDTIMVSAIQSVQFMVATIIEKGINRQLTPSVSLMGTADEAIYLSEFHGHEKDFPAGSLDRLQKIFEGLKDGSLRNQGVVPKSIFEQ